MKDRLAHRIMDVPLGSIGLTAHLAFGCAVWSLLSHHGSCRSSMRDSKYAKSTALGTYAVGEMKSLFSSIVVLAIAIAWTGTPAKGQTAFQYVNAWTGDGKPLPDTMGRATDLRTCTEAKNRHLDLAQTLNSPLTVTRALLPIPSPELRSNNRALQIPRLLPLRYILSAARYRSSPQFPVQQKALAPMCGSFSGNRWREITAKGAIRRPEHFRLRGRRALFSSE